MNHICQHAGFSEKHSQLLLERALSYIKTGMFPINSEPFAL